MIEGQYLQESVDRLYPNAIMIDAMKVWALPDKKKGMLPEICASGEYFGQIKKDGNWYQYVTAGTNAYLFSRTESVVSGLLTEKIENVPHIQKELSKLPPNTILIGEIYYPGLTSNEVRQVMGCKPAKAIKRQEELGNIKYYIHDIIMFNGVSLISKGAFERYNFLKAVFDKLSLLGDSIELAEAFEDNLYERTGQALESGEEGMVLKKKDCPYVPGKKPAWSAIKVKQVDYADVICMGFESPTEDYDGIELEAWDYWELSDGSKVNKEQAKASKLTMRPITKSHYYGWCGSIIIGAYNESNELISIGSVSSGLTDKLKEQMKQSPENYIGQVCKCQLMQKFEKAFRHCIFKGFRDDKNPKECTIDSIFGE